MESDAAVMRQNGPTIFIQAKHKIGIKDVADYILNAYEHQVNY